ncbi:hypothetical protein DVH05_002834 [Phytophthora capsici]|nr:hypothetical protein DVH05_002834 [Phytophthora capsici]
MWLSSFASDASSEPQRVRAHIWSACSPPLSSPTDDALALVATADVSLLRLLRVVHDSFVTIEFQERSHVARLKLLQKSIVRSSEETQGDNEAVGDVTLSPLLAFNLGIPLHSSTASQVTVSVSL